MAEMAGAKQMADNADLADFVMNGGVWGDTLEQSKSTESKVEAEAGAAPDIADEPEVALDGGMFIESDGLDLREEAQRAAAKGSPEVSETKLEDPSAEVSKTTDAIKSPEVSDTKLEGNPKLARTLADAADRLETYIRDGAGNLGIELGAARKGMRLFAGALSAAGVTPTPGEAMKLYLARDSEQFKTGKIVGSSTEMGALDIGRLKAVNAYTQMGLKNSLIREFSSIRRSFGTIGEDDLKELCKKVEIVAELKDGKITRDGEFVKTKIKDDDLISGIIEGKESAAFKKVVDEKGKHVGWTLANGKFLTEDGRQSIAAKVVSAHFEGSSALEYKGDQIIDAVSIVEGWKPVQINRFKESLEGNMRADGSISTQGQSWFGDILKVLELTIRKGG
jgi:hypothetical protein